jgi:hypothetical protein
MMKVDEAQLSCTKDELVAALIQEGCPANPTYRPLQSEAIWFRERKVFEGTDLPWGLPSCVWPHSRCPH